MIDSRCFADLNDFAPGVTQRVVLHRTLAAWSLLFDKSWDLFSFEILLLEKTWLSKGR